LVVRGCASGRKSPRWHIPLSLRRRFVVRSALGSRGLRHLSSGGNSGRAAFAGALKEPREESMRAVSILRFVIFGAVGFGVCGAIALALSLLWAGIFSLFALAVLFVLAVLIAGAVGGASLGLALNDSRLTALLALYGAGGMLLGLPIGGSLASYFNNSELYIAAIAGAMIGGLLGVALGDLPTILTLAVAGAVGFGVGYFAGDLLRASVSIFREGGEIVGQIGSITTAEVVGGASLGAALGYLESRKAAEARRTRVE
jgi:hypothetical protein